VNRKSMVPVDGSGDSGQVHPIAAALHRAVDAGRCPKKSVLVVDEEFLIRWALQQDLGDRYRVWTAPSVDEALKVLGRERIDALITDLRLPLGSGLELVKAVRAEWPRVRVFVASAAGTDDDMRRCYDYDVEAVLRKPLEVPILRGMLDFHLGQKTSP
jgi:DNA-binding NtrC family response regulator